MHNNIQSANRFLRRSPLLLAACLAAAATVGASGSAHAKAHGKSHGPAPKVGLMTFRGPGEAASRAAAEKALKSRKIVVVPTPDLLDAAKKAHVKLGGDDGFKAVAKALDLTAIVTGEVSKTKATIIVRTGEDGSVVGQETFQGGDSKKLAATIHKTFWKRLAGPFNKTKPPGGGNFEAPPPEEEPASAGGAETASEPSAGGAKRAEEASPTEARGDKKGDKKSEKKDEATEAKREAKTESSNATEESEPSSAGSAEAVDISAGPAWFMRSLSFNQPRNDLSTTKVASYSLPLAPVLFVRGDIFPAALAGATGFAANIGLTLDASYLLPVVKSAGNGGDYKTSGLAYSAGLKVRLPAGLFATVAYADQSFKLTKSNSGMPDPVVPGVNYKFARIGAGIRNQATSSLMLQANLGYLLCLGKPGDIASSAFFPRTTCNGFEGGVGAGYRLAAQWELRAGVDFRRVGLAFHVKSSDVTNDPATTPPIAGGAVDQYIQVYAGLAFVFGSGPSAPPEPEPASSEEGAKSAKAAKAAKSDDDDDASEGGE